MTDFYSSIDDCTAAHASVVAAFATGNTRNIEWRKNQLKQLGLMIQENEKAFTDAVYLDLNRPAFETITAETNAIKAEVNEAIAHLAGWAKPQGVKTSLIWWATKPSVVAQPVGATLIIAPWNFPLGLLFGPLVGAMAAGCSAVIKPAEQSANTSRLIAKLVPQYLDESAYRVINGAVAEVTALLKLRWDLIFYTGSSQVGKIIARAAAEFLTPTILELGGKSPAVVFDDADIDITARRLMWGKYTNAGQICIAPDYVICTKALQPKLVASCKKALAEFSPASGLLENENYSKIITENHYNRLNKILDGTKGEVVIGGGKDDKLNKIEVTVVTNVSPSDSLMEGEIFGPLLPIVTMESREEAVAFINSNENPLALYSFTGDSNNTKYLSEHTRSGSCVQNDVLVQFLIPGLPFGGSGNSGMGNYHGKSSFDAFSHSRAHAAVPFYMELGLASRYPPYTAGKLKLMMLAAGATIAGKSSKI